MLSVGFWNLKKLSRADMVGKLAREHALDVVILVECDQPHDVVTQCLNDTTDSVFRIENVLSNKVRLYSSLPPNSVRPVFDSHSGRFSIQRIVLSKTDLLLVAVHLHSKINRNDADQLQFTQLLSLQIKSSEDYFKHQRTVLVGDLNMNPFDTAMVAAHGLHSVMTRAIANERARSVDAQEYPFFYNPMWGMMGDRTPGPSGTHYCRLGKPTEYFWNTFDQLLIRPDLLHAFNEDLQIVTAIEGVSLLSKQGLPNERIGSDHLPLVFRLNIE